MNKKYKELNKIGYQLINSIKKQKNSFSKKEDIIWNKINAEITPKSNTRFYVYSLISGIAATLFIFLLLSLYKEFHQSNSLDLYVQQIDNPTYNEKDIKLYLSPDEKISIKENKAFIKYNTQGTVSIKEQQKRQQKDTIVSSKNNQIEFNQLIVPKGKFTNLILSDSSELYINSGTRVIYPRIFSSSVREIYVEGEIYINVAKNKHIPFIIKTASCKIQVLGTSFNVNAYKDNTKTEVVLVDGSIRLSDKSHNTIDMTPNQKVSIKNGQINDIKKVNATDYITWKDGILLLKSETLYSVFKRLERFYGNHIQVSTQAGQLKINGKIDLNLSLDQLMELITKTAPITYKKDTVGNYIVNSQN